MANHSLIEQLADLVARFHVEEYFRDTGSFDNEILRLSGHGLDIEAIRDRGFISYRLRLSGSSRWFPFGIIWRFITGSKTEPGQNTAFNTIMHGSSKISEALGTLKGRLLESVEARELLLAREELVHMGAMDRSHPLYKEALAAVAKASGNN